VGEATMNYSCVMVGGITILLTIGYFWKRKRGYIGPQVAFEGRREGKRKERWVESWETRVG
jgi:hypothetical protein